MSRWNNRETVVYFMYDERATLLWVGMTVNLKDRIRTHERSSHWFEWVTSIGMTDPMTHGEATVHERRQITMHRPVFNTRDNPAHHADPYRPVRYRRERGWAA